MTLDEIQQFIGQRVVMSRPWDTKEEVDFYECEECSMEGILTEIKQDRVHRVWLTTDDGMGILYDDTLKVELANDTNT